MNLIKEKLPNWYPEFVNRRMTDEVTKLVSKIRKS